MISFVHLPVFCCFVQTMSSYVNARAKSTDATGEGDGSAVNSKLWNRFNMNVTLTVLFMMLLALNAPPMITWAHNWSM